MALSIHDLKKLRDNPSQEGRISVADGVAQEFVTGAFAENERRIAIEIFRLLVSDAEVRVRKMLSAHLAHSMDVPHDIVLSLAKDIPSVALPMLQHSYVLSEEDLIAITNSTKDIAVMSAIARRDMVSCELSEALLAKSNVAVTQALLLNKSANIDDKGLRSIYEACSDNASVLELMVKRGGLPMTLVEKLFTAVSDEIKKTLTQQYNLSVQVADDSVKDVREFATLGLMDTDMGTLDVSRLVDQLYVRGRLTMSIIIRSLCIGDLRFFEHAMAKLADLPITNVQLLVLDQGDTGFISLYKSSCLPMELFEATDYLLRFALEETGFGRYQRSDFRRRLADRLIRDDNAHKIEYMDYLLTLIQNKADDATTLA